MRTSQILSCFILAVIAIGCDNNKSSLHEAPIITFEKAIGNSDWQMGLASVQSSDGGYLIAGITGDSSGIDENGYLVKINSSGDTLWTRSYGMTYRDGFFDIKSTSDGGVIIVGRSIDDIQYDNVYVIKLDAISNLQWSRYYGSLNDSEEAASILQTPDGGYLICGRNGINGVYYDVYLLKINSSGDSLWSKTYSRAGNNFGSSILNTNDGGYIIAGHTVDSGNEDVYLVKTDATGNITWNKTYGGSGNDIGRDIKQTKDNGYIIVGRMENDIYLIKANSSGDTVWTRTFDGYGYWAGSSVELADDGGFLVAGSVLNNSNNSSDVYLLKVSANGDSLWSRSFGGAADDYGYSIKQCLDGGYFITGMTYSYGVGGDVYVIKVNEDGNFNEIEKVY
ncbi:hypothetical protein JNM05_07000 [bacterium]|nr:hypothetical protein [bacterium]